MKSDLSVFHSTHLCVVWSVWWNGCSSYCVSVFNRFTWTRALPWSHVYEWCETSTPCDCGWRCMCGFTQNHTLDFKQKSFNSSNIKEMLLTSFQSIVSLVVAFISTLTQLHLCVVQVNKQHHPLMYKQIVLLSLLFKHTQHNHEGWNSPINITFEWKQIMMEYFQVWLIL